MFEEKTFADAQQTSSDSLFENLASKLFQEAQPALPLEAKGDEPEAAPVIGTPIERLTRYMELIPTIVTSLLHFCVSIEMEASNCRELKYLLQWSIRSTETSC